MRQTKSSVVFHYQPRLNGYVAVFIEPRDADSTTNRDPILLSSEARSEDSRKKAQKLGTATSCESVANDKPATKKSALAFIDMK